MVSTSRSCTTNETLLTDEQIEAFFDEASQRVEAIRRMLYGKVEAALAAALKGQFIGIQPMQAFLEVGCIMGLGFGKTGLQAAIDFLEVFIQFFL